MDLNKKVLIVEDDQVLQKIIVDQLANNFLVVTASDGEEALSIIAREKPDTIVLDLLLPKVDGFAVMQSLRSMDDVAMAHTPVIVVSNLSDQEKINKAHEYKIEEYFLKSDINMGILLNRIKRIFNSGPSVKW